MRGLELTPKEASNVVNALIHDQNVLKTILNLLSDAEVSIVLHPPALTAKQSSNLGVNTQNIVKSIVFSTEHGGVLVLVQGNRKVDWSKLKTATNTKKPRLATAHEVIQWTGCRIGGVSPFATELPILMDKAILNQEWVNPAGGSSVVGIRLKPTELKRLTGAEVQELS